MVGLLADELTLSSVGKLIPIKVSLAPLSDTLLNTPVVLGALLSANLFHSFDLHAELMWPLQAHQGEGTFSQGLQQLTKLASSQSRMLNTTARVQRQMACMTLLSYCSFGTHAWHFCLFPYGGPVQLRLDVLAAIAQWSASPARAVHQVCLHYLQNNRTSFCGSLCPAASDADLDVSIPDVSSALSPGASTQTVSGKKAKKWVLF